MPFVPDASPQQSVGRFVPDASPPPMPFSGPLESQARDPTPVSTAIANAPIGEAGAADADREESAGGVSKFWNEKAKPWLNEMTNYRPPPQSLAQNVKGAYGVVKSAVTAPFKEAGAAGFDAMRALTGVGPTGNEKLAEWQGNEPPSELEKGIGLVTRPVSGAIEMLTPTDTPIDAVNAASHAARGVIAAAPTRAIERKTEVIPGIAERKAMGQTHYDIAKHTGELVPNQHYGPLINDVETYLSNKGFHPQDNPAAARTLDRLYEAGTNPKASFTNPTGMMSLREGLTNAVDSAFQAAKPGTVSRDMMLTEEVLDKFDDWMDQHAPAASAARGSGAADWRIYRNSQTIQQIFDRADIRAGQYSNAGHENALRVEFAQLAQNPRRMRYFNDAEKDAIRAVAKGTPTQIAVRQIGKLFSPHTTGGLALDGIVASLFGLPGGAAAAGVGTASKVAAGRMRIRAAENARDLVQLGGRRPVSRLGLAALPRTGVLGLPALAGAAQDEQ